MIQCEQGMLPRENKPYQSMPETIDVNDKLHEKHSPHFPTPQLLKANLNYYRPMYVTHFLLFLFHS